MASLDKKRPASGKVQRGAPAAKHQKLAAGQKSAAGAAGRPAKKAPLKKGGSSKPSPKGAAKPTNTVPAAPSGAKLTKHDKKAQMRAKKSAIKPNFGLIQDTVTLWEALRPRNQSEAEKQELVTQIMAK
ncbi:pumilio family protein, partial [Haematococcus lacustris]